MNNKIKTSTKAKHSQTINKNDNITSYNLEFVDKLIKSVSEMSDSEYKDLMKSIASFHRYSVSNQFLLHAAWASQVAWFQKWKEMERKVKRWAKAVWILAPMMGKKEMEDWTEEAKIYWFKSIPVFDIADTEGKEIERWMTKSSNVEFEKVRQYATNNWYSVELKPLEVATGWYISENSIVLNSNLSSSEHIWTLIHELCHWELGHTTSLELWSRSLKEQEAETTTAIICNILGIERNSEFYLKAWNLDKKIKKSFEKIDWVVKKVVKFFEEESIQI